MMQHPGCSTESQRATLLRHWDEHWNESLFWRVHICACWVTLIPQLYPVIPWYITAQWSTGAQRVFPPVVHWRKVLNRVHIQRRRHDWHVYNTMSCFPALKLVNYLSTETPRRPLILKTDIHAVLAHILSYLSAIIPLFIHFLHPPPSASFHPKWYFTLRLLYWERGTWNWI